MIARYVFIVVFIFIGVFGFMFLQYFKAVGVGTLNDSLKEDLNKTGNYANTIYSKVESNILAYYDIASWIFLASPFLYLAVQVLKREQEPREVGYG
jgi:hypothetical protein